MFGAHRRSTVSVFWGITLRPFRRQWAIAAFPDIDESDTVSRPEWANDVGQLGIRPEDADGFRRGSMTRAIAVLMLLPLVYWPRYVWGVRVSVVHLALFNVDRGAGSHGHHANASGEIVNGITTDASPDPHIVDGEKPAAT